MHQKSNADLDSLFYICQKTHKNTKLRNTPQFTITFKFKFNPHEFRPERFLNVDQEAEKLVFKPHPALIPYGIGKSDCLGRSLAKMELFMFLSALLHRFEFEWTSKGIPNIDDCHVGVTRMPMPFASKIKCRS